METETHRPELLSTGAERGNYSEAKPKRKGRKGRPACNDASCLSGYDSSECMSAFYGIEVPLRSDERSGNRQHNKNVHCNAAQAV